MTTMTEQSGGLTLSFVDAPPPDPLVLSVVAGSRQAALDLASLTLRLDAAGMTGPRALARSLAEQVDHLLDDLDRDADTPDRPTRCSDRDFAAIDLASVSLGAAWRLMDEGDLEGAAEHLGHAAEAFAAVLVETWPSAAGVTLH